MATLTSRLLLTLKDGVTGPARGVAGALARLQKRSRAFQRNQRAMTGAMTGAVGRIAALGGAYIGLRESFAGTIGGAMSFEDAMANVRKVIDFKSPAAFKSMRKDILDLSRVMPISAEGFASIYAAAGQANIPTEKLKQFATMTAKVSTAWDLTAGETGSALAEIRTALGLTVSDTGLVADAINHLGNNTAASAPKLLNFAKRVGAIAKTSGMAAKDASAFGAAMIATGFAPEQAATSYINMVTRLSGGARAQKGTKQAMRLLGFEPKALQKQLKKDATGTILKVLKALKNKIPEAERISVAKSLFGAEARALAPLIDDATELRRALGLVAQETQFAGSAQREYEEASKRTSNSLKKLKNSVRAIGIGFGDIVLPSIAQWAEDAAAALQPGSNRLTIFDRIKAASNGLAKGLGFADAAVSVDAFKASMESLRTYLFGHDLSKVDPGLRKHLEAANAANLGGIAAKFQTIGDALGGFADAVQNLSASAAASNLMQLGTGLSDLMGGMSFLGVGVLAVAGAGLLSLSKGLLALMPVRTLVLMGIATGIFAISKAVQQIADGASFSEAISNLSAMEKALGGLTVAWGAWKIFKAFGGGFKMPGGPKTGKFPKGSPGTGKLPNPASKSGLLKKFGKFGKFGRVASPWAIALGLVAEIAGIEGDPDNVGLPKTKSGAFNTGAKGKQSTRERLMAQREAALARRNEQETRLLRSPPTPARQPTAIEKITSGVQPAKPTVDMSDVEAGVEQSVAAGERIKSGLDVSGKPKVDTSDLERAMQILRQANAELLKFLGNAQRAENAASAASRSVGNFEQHSGIQADTEWSVS